VEALALFESVAQGFRGESQAGPVTIAVFGGAELVSAIYGFAVESTCRSKLPH
jgi:hypothetical protein